MCNEREGVPPAPLPPPKRVFAPTPPPFFKIRNAFSQIPDCNCLTINVLYLLTCKILMYAHIRASVCKRN